MSVKNTTYFTLFNCKFLLKKSAYQLYYACNYHIKVYYTLQSLLIDTVKYHPPKNYTYQYTR